VRDNVTNRKKAVKIGRIGTMMAVTALAIAGPGAVFSAQAASDTTPPTAPTNITFHKLADPSPGQVQIFFTQSTDPDDAQTSLQYVLRRNGQVDGGGIFPVVNANPGDVFTITAIDPAGNSTTSQPVTWNGKFSN
jgi:hypothetical protein